ncbi:hypothetical protein BO86DRAFT_190831 [Aspergillus japonicus CBS 114.51]|uniref:Uncharacterized protein n=2 Tax=Aspergillus TaxID=5052 RepID=A0A2V5HIV9_ASPV1|nr:hypothetical protein BO86DRAFT_190831 [Aspergillus japonicus CBS 114.51]PYI21313.1 hypothetical protein BO99DRAFT_83425 [Aspergillus violaceofuscus CBS 115571]RAH85400.1 hypothetical protein BO86DRAFT_190831 [Aspergillus japonicus CBS 114.51]
MDGFSSLRTGSQKRYQVLLLLHFVRSLFISLLPYSSSLTFPLSYSLNHRIFS